MTNLLWPGDHRAGEHMTDQSLMWSMVAVESAWLSALAAAGLAPADAEKADLSSLVDQGDVQALAVAAENSGNPIVGLVELLRERAKPPYASWIHRGLTSQDVVDTALMLGVRAVVDELRTDLSEQVSTLAALANAHRATPMVARTLTQQAAPTTFGAKAAGWLQRCRRRVRATVRSGDADPGRRCRRNMVGHHGTRDTAHRCDRPGGSIGAGDACCCSRFGSGCAAAVAYNPDAGDRGGGCLPRMHR